MVLCALVAKVKKKKNVLYCLKINDAILYDYDDCDYPQWIFFLCMKIYSSECCFIHSFANLVFFVAMNYIIMDLYGLLFIFQLLLQTNILYDFPEGRLYIKKFKKALL